MFSRSWVVYNSTKRIRNSIFQSLLHNASAVRNHYSVNIPSRLGHKDWLAPNEVLQVFAAIKDPISITTALQHYSKRKDYKPNEALYTLIINKLGQAHLFDAIEDVMNRIKAERNCRLSDEFFRGVIKIYGNVGGRINKAMETLFDMPDYNCWPTVKTFNFVLNLLVSSKLFDVVHELYVAAPKLGIEIDACCLNILIKALCECGKLDAAVKLLDEFPKQRCKPTAMTFSTLMHGLCDNGKVEEALGFLETMEKEGIDPDTITFNILISGLRKQGRVEEGMVLLERMKLKGCNPNAASYQEVLYGLLDMERFVEAKEFMSRIILKGVNPSFVSYRLLVYGLCKKNLLEDIDWVLIQMARQGFVPKMGMWRQILQIMFHGENNHSYIYSKEIVENLIIGNG
ncbi:pentatricopeptide repeat-containing protein At3g14580, mitochondrial [Ziziphus jujuba]|uniref:Pentatricopeptide repeat-containing protein At3g14580, mitochondrial n=1 Tax=Ziziphus jujuba TaxID=326968 RepID=A0ABM3I6C8_ZIZJJ|nr:pentatricopeptide repeat-containing protein At3g14580, mitochondrial [Ziziphus jujuba]